MQSTQPDTTLPIRADAAFASRAAAEFFAVVGEARPLPGEYDDNFHLATPSGDAFVLKIMHPGRERELIELQCRALEHLDRRAPSLRVPRVQRSRDGETFASIRDEQGTSRFLWMLSYVPGRAFVDCRPHAPAVLRGLGQFLGELDRALSDFDDPAARRELKWDSTRASWINEYLDRIEDPARRRIVETFMQRYEAEVLPVASQVRYGVIHGDANDHNVLTEASRAELPRVVSVIDFGDIHRGMVVSEVAIAAAYALLDEEDPLAAAAHLAGGYHAAHPLTEQEIALLFPLIATRLCVSVVNSALRKTLAPDDAYITISERPAWTALERLAAIPPALAHYRFRAACDLPSVPHSSSVVAWLRSNANSLAAIVDGISDACVLDLGVGSLLTGADPSALETESLTETVFREMSAAGASIGVGRYDEPRMMYTAPQFLAFEKPMREARTIHLGMDLFATEGTAVYAPLDGVVHALANNASSQDYGPVIILRHEPEMGAPFFTLYGHLSLESLDGIAVGQRVARGARIATIGGPSVNGGWVPHVHFQIITDLLGMDVDFPGVGRASEREVWKSLSPDANLVARVPPHRFPAAFTRDETLQRRKSALGRNLSVSYRNPLKIVRGWKQYLYDDTGRGYLDAYNNVPLVGHSHPRVVKAAQQQIALLNTNTRYLHDNIVQYAERLTALMPEPLRVCYFLNSASEANELALRLARAYTGRYDIIALEHAYHGHTNTLIDISPYKFEGPGGYGRKPWVHVAPIADDYRGPYKRGLPDAGRKYADGVAELIVRGVSPAAFIAETLPSVGGQIVFPPEYLTTVYAAVRAAGGICIADEVQVGFGRLGSCLWGFESQGVVPDMVVLGKPIGNGFPLAAVVTTQAIAAAFDNGMEFFSTFGGNPVACAVGLAVLDVVRDEGLVENAHRVGTYLRSLLSALVERHPLVGDVRGMGLFLGVELVRDRDTLEPAGAEASYVIDRLRDNGVLTGSDGPYHNVLKVRPPLCFTERDADLLVRTLDEVLAEDGLNFAT